MGLLLKPRNVIDSPALAAYLRRGLETYAGINVSPASALSVAAVFACTRVISEDIGKLPFEVFNQTSDRERQRATGSPLWRLIHERPNSYQTSQQVREYLTACALLRGNGYALKNVVQGQVRELLPLTPSQVRVEQLEDFELVFHVTMPDGHEEPMTRREIFHLPGLTIDGPIGVSVITYARQTVGIALGANRHAGTFFGRQQDNLTGTKVADRLVRDSGTNDRHIDKMFFCILYGLANRFRYFHRFAAACAHAPCAVTHDHQRRKAHIAAALNGLADAVDRYELLFKLFVHFFSASHALKSSPQNLSPASRAPSAKEETRPM